MPGAIEHFLRDLAVDLLRPQINQHEVIVGSAGDNAEAMLRHARGERLGVQHHLPLIFAEARLQRLVETNRLRRDHVHERAALDAGED